MITMPLAEAKNRLSELIARAESGEEVRVTRRGRPVARLVPVAEITTESRQTRVAEVFRQLERLTPQLRLEGELKAIAHEGLD